MEAAIEDMRLLKLAEVKRLTSLSQPTIWRLIQKDQFPRPMQVTSSRVAWRETDVREWLASRKPTLPEKERR